LGDRTPPTKMQPVLLTLIIRVYPTKLGHHPAGHYARRFPHWAIAPGAEIVQALGRGIIRHPQDALQVSLRHPDSDTGHRFRQELPWPLDVAPCCWGLSAVRR